MAKNSYSLNDIYGSRWEVDDHEVILGFVDAPSEWEIQYPVQEYNVEQLKELETPHGDETVFNAFKKYAKKSQREIVDYYVKNDAKRNELPIVIGNKTVLDGNHRLIAAIKKGVPIKVIDVYGEEYESLNESIINDCISNDSLLESVLNAYRTIFTK